MARRTTREFEEDMTALTKADLSVRRFTVRHALRALPDLLQDRERVDRVACGVYEGRPGLVALTDRRLLFVESRRRHRLDWDVAFSRMISVECELATREGRLKIFTAGGSAEITCVKPRRQASDIARRVRERLTDSA